MVFKPRDHKEIRQLLARAAVPPIVIEVKCPVPTSNLSYFFMGETEGVTILRKIRSFLKIFTKCHKKGGGKDRPPLFTTMFLFNFHYRS